MKLRMAVLKKKTIFEECLVNVNEEFHGMSEWIVMGHFDSLTVCELSIKKGFFNTIYNENKKLLSSRDSDSYCYPIYLMTNSDDKKFLNIDSTFSALVKVHFISSIDYEKNFKELIEKLKKDTQCNDVKYHVYNTFELSDAVIILKSNHISSILKLTAILRAYNFIGKIYTYPSVAVNSLKNDTFFDECDKIDFISLRISLRSTAKINDFISCVKKILKSDSAYFITGVDDILINIPNANAKKIYKLYNEIFVNPQGNFSNFITRIGITISDEHFNISSSDDCTNNILFETCESLILKLDDMSNIFISQNHKWFNSLFELIKLLSRMSKTPVLDEFVYLLLPGMVSFIDNLYYIRLNSEELECYSSEYNVFVQSLIDLIEQVMRSEVQYAHSPELRPIMYNLPIVMLEYTQAFLKECSELLKQADNTQDNIRLLLVPKIINRLETVEIFSSYNIGKGLLEINIPLDMLYNPSQLQCNLCHEISHFIGEKHRKRNDRMEYYSTAVAILMTKLFFGTFSKSMVDSIKNQLLNCLNSYGNVEERTMMHQMQENVETWIEEWFVDENKYYTFVRGLLKSLSSEEPVAITGDFDAIHFIYSKHFYSLLQQIGDLFKEIYADICMLILLPLSSEDYVKQFCSELEGENPNYPLDDMDERVFGSQLYEFYTVRLYVSLKSSNKMLPKFTQSDPEYYRIICENIQRIDAEIDKKDEIDSYFPKGVVRQLLKYGKNCYESLNQSLKPDDLLRVRNTALSNSSVLKYEKICELIDKYRKDLLNYFNHNL